METANGTGPEVPPGQGTTTPAGGAARVAPGPAGNGAKRAERSAMTIVKSIVDDVGLLVRKEIELAKEELKAGLVARGVGAGALAAAGVMALLGVIFIAMAVAAALDLVMPAWLARLVVALGFLAMAGGAALFGRRRIKSVPMVPEETKRTIKEDVEWAKAHLGR
jgi:Putative Actinobacterial Holin-X, holin superfamily III